MALLTHPLRPGISPVFRDLSTGWDALEVDVVRAIRLFRVSRGLLQHWGLGVHALGPAEMVVACMTVCVHEHGFGSAVSGMDSSAEVFWDDPMEESMVWLVDRLH